MRAALALMLLLAPTLLVAGQYSDLYVIPVAGHVTGLGGSSWMSDVAIQNFQSAPLTVQIVVIESGEAMPDNVKPLQSSVGSAVTIPAGGTRILRDVLNGHRATDTIGAILIGADLPFAVSSRAYVTSANGATQGESVIPVRDFLDNSLSSHTNLTASAYVPGLTANSRYRTNLGLVAGSSSAAGVTVEVTLRGADGASLGSRTFGVAANGFEHIQFSSTSITNQAFDEGSATFRIVAGDGAVVPYASVVDNISSAAYFVTGQFPPDAPFSNVTFRALFQEMRDR
ncbi:MAG TPA: hypothetical protein VGK31_14655 [Thermoanaerobaculia bacterium]